MQFRVLYRDFLHRMIDLEILSTHGEISRLLVQFAAMLAAFSLVVTVYGVGPVAISNIPRAQLLLVARDETEFLIATTMAIAGLFAVLAWTAVFPDRRDCLVLGLLPVRARTILAAKLAAIGTALGVSIGAVNAFTGLTYPLVIAPEGVLGGARTFLVYWAVTAGAGLFVACALLAVQGIAAHLLSYRLFLRVSSFLQLAAFFLILGVYFLKPPVESTWAGPYLPSFWFFALFQKLEGVNDPVLGPLAARAWWSLAAVFAVAAGTLALAYRRNLRRIVEQPDIAPADRSHAPARALRFLAKHLLSRPVERAIALFTARTIARSRQHRLLLAAYAGIGLAIALAYTRSLLYGTSSLEPMYRQVRWNQVNGSFLAASMVMLFFAVIGTRAVFALPIALPANWIFRITVVHRPALYFSAARKALLGIAVAPVWIACAIVFPIIWPWRPSLEHVVILGVVAVLTVECALGRFRKIPFACSYLPGKANLQVRLGAFGIGFLAAADRGVAIEWWTLEGTTRFVVLLAILIAAVFWARRRREKFANAHGNHIQFEDLPPAELNTLDLHRDGAASHDDVYLDTVAEPRDPMSLATIGEQILRDLRYGARILTRSPGFSAAAVALIAVGLGGNAAVYSMIHGMLEKPATGVRAGGLVSVAPRIRGRVSDPGDNSFLDYLDYAAQTRTLSSLAGIASDRYTMETREGSYEVRGELVTANYFQTLGVRLAAGREFNEEDTQGGSPIPAIIAWHVWQNQFHGATDAIGQPILLNGQAATVVGIGPPGFHGSSFAPNLEVCIPLSIYSQRGGMRFGERSMRGVGMIGRLAPGASLSQAQAEFATIASRLEAAYPEADEGKSMVLAPYSATRFGPLQGGQTRVFMAILTAVALLTLLIACANVGNLMLSRSVMRQREMAVRRSLGAPRVRILGILFAEGLVLSLTACVAAWLFASWACKAVVQLIPPLESGARVQPDLSPDWQVAGYAMVLAVVSTLVFTIAPALRAWRQELLPALKAGEHGVIAGRSKLATILVVAQLALCALLLTAGGLAWRSVSLMDAEDLGFDRDHVLLAGVNTKGAVSTGDQHRALLERIRARLSAVPGVVSVSYALAPPPHSHGWMGLPVRANASSQPAHTDGTYVGPEYLQVLRVPMLAGRGITAADSAGAGASAVITQKLARELWPDQSPLGRTFQLHNGETLIQVVGVVPDGAFNGVGEDGGFSGLSKNSRRNFVFLAVQQGGGGPGPTTFHVRYAGSLNSVAAAVRAVIQQTDSHVPVFSMRTMQTEWDEFVSPVRIVTDLLGLFAAGALVLASIGLYAVVAFYTARRTREFGIRMALGASTRQALGSVLREGLLLTGVGIGVGLAVSAAAGRVFGNLLFGVSPTDAITYSVVIVSLTGVSLLATYVPARRASRIDPSQALRQD